MMLWFILSQWTRRSASSKIQELRKEGEVLLSSVCTLPLAEAEVKLERLISQNAFLVKQVDASERAPDLLRELPSTCRHIFEAYKYILEPESSLELSWDFFDLRSGQRIRVGCFGETQTEVLVETSTGKVIVGRDVFPSLAHLLIFETQ